MGTKTKRTIKTAATDFEDKFLDSAAFDKADFSLDWLIKNVLLRGQPGVIGGPMKTLKTGIAIDMAISLASGTPFLGKFDVPRPVRVALMSGESGKAVLRQQARCVCKQKGLSLEECDVLWSSHLPRLARRADRVGLKHFLKNEKVEFVLLDPLYLCLLSGASNISASNLYQMGPLLLRVGQACLSAGATPVFVHHTVKGISKSTEPRAALGLESLAFSGIGEFVRQWVLLNRRCPFEEGSGRHDLVMSVGGSAGHSGRWQVEVNEGILDERFKGRRWQVKVVTGNAPAVKAKDITWDVTDPYE